MVDLGEGGAGALIPLHHSIPVFLLAIGAHLPLPKPCWQPVPSAVSSEGLILLELGCLASLPEPGGQLVSPAGSRSNESDTDHAPLFQSLRTAVL